MKLNSFYSGLKGSLFLELPDVNKENIPAASLELSLKINEMLSLTFAIPAVKRIRLLMCASMRGKTKRIHPRFLVGKEYVYDITELRFDDTERVEVDVDKYLGEKNIKHAHIDRDELKKVIDEMSNSAWCEVELHENGRTVYEIDKEKYLNIQEIEPFPGKHTLGDSINILSMVGWESSRFSHGISRIMDKYLDRKEVHSAEDFEELLSDAISLNGGFYLETERGSLYIRRICNCGRNECKVRIYQKCDDGVFDRSSIFTLVEGENRFKTDMRFAIFAYKVLTRNTCKEYDEGFMAMLNCMDVF